MKTQTLPLLLVDVSNTFSKFAAVKNGKIQRPVRIETSKICEKSWTPPPQMRLAEKICIASVVPRATQVFYKLRPDAEFLSGTRSLPVQISYPHAAEIGADRLANAIALHKLGRFPAIALDFGTAITLDILDERGFYCGGVIAPGWQMMLSYLHEKTALLPRVRLTKQPDPIGKSTSAAICAGVHYGFIGLVRNILKHAISSLPRSPALIIATGGDSNWISREIPDIQYTDPLLTLRGIQIFAESLH